MAHSLINWGIDESSSYPYLLANEQTPHPGLVVAPPISLAAMQAVALITGSVSLGAVGLNTPALYASGLSSTTASSSSGTQSSAANIATEGGPRFQAGDNSGLNPIVENDLSSLFNN